MQREEESITKMLGANLEQTGMIGVITAEAMASYLGWDSDGVAIDAVAEERADDDTPELSPPS